MLSDDYDPLIGHTRSKKYPIYMDTNPREAPHVHVGSDHDLSLSLVTGEIKGNTINGNKIQRKDIQEILDWYDTYRDRALNLYNHREHLEEYGAKRIMLMDFYADENEMRRSVSHEY